ncbi:MAG: 3-isopropylmalate dehydratase [Anaerolineaceae bacterium]|nr:3-isopropylmalate dehydratase [Anaerolineaceae bacterium]
MTTHRVWVYGDHVNTDVIFPGKYTYTLKTPEEIASKALEDLDPTFAAQARAGDVIVAGRNWGCGSSREQAVTALKYAGITMVIATSFNGLYYRNCINQGVWPVVCPGLVEYFQSGDTIQVDPENSLILAGGETFTMPPLPESVRAILNAGGLVPMLQARFQGA